MKLLAMVVLGTGVVWAISMAPLHNLPGEPAGLTSEIREEREAAAQAMCQQRAKIIKDLISLAATKVEPVPSDSQGFPQVGVWHDAKHLAMLLLGDIRASEGVSVLVENTEYRVPKFLSKGYELGRIEGPGWHPAVESLIKIGMPSVDPVLEKLGSYPENCLGRRLCLVVLKGILGPKPAKVRLEIAVEEVKTDAARANLKAALGQLQPGQGAPEAAQALIATAQDASRPREERRQAIFLLAKTRTPESVQFLIDNVSLRIPMSIALGDEDMAKSWPCRRALIEDEDWGMAKAVLDALKAPRPAEDVMHMSYVLERILSRPLALAAVDCMERGSTGVWRDNLSAVKAILTK